MSAKPISRFPVPKLKDLPADVRERIEAVAEKTGFVPNVFLALAHRPDEWRAFVAYHDALMEKESGLSKAEREMIVVATSAENDCLYCVVAHGAIVRIRTKDALVADQVAVDWRKADITPRQKAMLAFAVNTEASAVRSTRGRLQAPRRLAAPSEPGSGVKVAGRADRRPSWPGRSASRRSSAHRDGWARAG